VATTHKNFSVHGKNFENIFRGVGLLERGVIEIYCK